MAEARAVLDYCQSGKENEELVLRLVGWFFADQKESSFHAEISDHVLKTEYAKMEREDVLAALPDTPFPDSQPGYILTVRIPAELIRRKIEEASESEERLSVSLQIGEKEFSLYEKTIQELSRMYFADSIMFYMDIAEKRLDQIYLQGWCINQLGQLDMQLLDVREDGSAQRMDDGEWKSIRRRDLVEVFNVEEDQCHGFSVSVPRRMVRGKVLRLTFSNPSTEKHYELDLQEFDRKFNRRSRFMQLLDKENKEKNKELRQSLGIRGFWDYLVEESGEKKEQYAFYQKHMSPTARELRRQRKALPHDLCFSIVVPMYKTPLPYLKELVDSVRAQSYPNWQLCLADGSPDDTIGQYLKEHYRDDRICYEHLSDNTGIAGNTNAALHMAGGDVIVFTDHDDTLAPDALYENAKVFLEHPEVEFIYSDEDIIDEDENVTAVAHFKPDYSPDYLCSINYFCHLVCLRRELYQRVGDLNPEYDGAQDYDFVLRCTEQMKGIWHIPKILYHWRSHQGSTAGNEEGKTYAFEAGARALNEHYRRIGVKAQAEYTGITVVYRTRYEIENEPLISILIPNKDHTEDLDQCITSIEEKSTYRNFEILVIENNSELEETFRYYEEIGKKYSNVEIVRYEGGFNYSAINNFGAGHARGSYLLLLNNDTEVITPDWLEQMLGYCQREDTGIVGVKLLYPDDTVQHAGVVIGIGGVAGHILTGLDRHDTGYLRRLAAAHDVSAVTAACLMVRKSVYDAVNGLDESFAVAFNDVDFCLRVREMGKLVVLLPEVQLYHYESKSRGYETTPEKKARFDGEVKRFRERYQDFLEKGDPYYNPNLTLNRGDCSTAHVYEIRKGRMNG